MGALSFVASFFGAQMLGWLVDSGSPSIVIAYALVSVVFVILRRRERDMARPFRIGGHGNGGLVIGVLSTGLCLALAGLYLPGMPAFLSPPVWTIFGLWWVLGAVFLFRIPHRRPLGPRRRAAPRGGGRAEAGRRGQPTGNTGGLARRHTGRPSERGHVPRPLR